MFQPSCCRAAAGARGSRAEGGWNQDKGARRGWAGGRCCSKDESPREQRGRSSRRRSSNPLQQHTAGTSLGWRPVFFSAPCADLTLPGGCILALQQQVQECRRLAARPAPPRLQHRNRGGGEERHGGTAPLPSRPGGGHRHRRARRTEGRQHVGEAGAAGGAGPSLTPSAAEAGRGGGSGLGGARPRGRRAAAEPAAAEALLPALVLSRSPPHRRPPPKRCSRPRC